MGKLVEIEQELIEVVLSRVRLSGGREGSESSEGGRE